MSEENSRQWLHLILPSAIITFGLASALFLILNHMKADLGEYLPEQGLCGALRIVFAGLILCLRALTPWTASD